MERSKQKKTLNWNKTVLLGYKPSLLQALTTGNTRGVKSTPTWRAGSSQLGKVRKALAMQHATNTRTSMPAPALPQGREESAKEDMENKGHLQTPIYRFMDHTDLQQLHVESIKVALNKQTKIPASHKNTRWCLAQKEDQVLSIQTGPGWKEAKHNAADSQHFLYRSAKSSHTNFSNKEHSNLPQGDRS